MKNHRFDTYMHFMARAKACLSLAPARASAVARYILLSAILACQPNPVTIDWQREIMLREGELRTWVLTEDFRGDKADDVARMRAQFAADLSMRTDLATAMGSQPFSD